MNRLFAALLLAALAAGCAAPTSAPAPSGHATSPTAATPSSPPPPAGPAAQPAPASASPPEPSNPQPPGVFDTSSGALRANVTVSGTGWPGPGKTSDFRFLVPASDARLVLQVRVRPTQAGLPADVSAQAGIDVIAPNGSTPLSFDAADLAARDYRIDAAPGSWTLRAYGTSSHDLQVVAWGTP